MNPDIYGISLWILSSVVLVASVVILMVILISPVGIHPQCKFALWYCSTP
jgi:membrane protein YdbS with pleckstrin-like domain